MTVLCLRMLWKGKGVEPFPIQGFHQVDIIPSEEHPFGQRGLVLWSAWVQASDTSTTGMLLLDGDVVVDPEDIRHMFNAIAEQPDIVLTAPIKIWPKSTKRQHWVWGHTLTQDIEGTPTRFTFGFTYIPRGLIESYCIEMKTWKYPYADMEMSKAAFEVHTPIEVVLTCEPKHLNF